MMTKEHMFEAVATEISEWIERMAEEVADALMEGGRSPFGAPVTERQKLEYYEQQLFLPDGTPNVPGRQRLLQRAGVGGFVDVMNAVMKKRMGMAETATMEGQNGVA